MRGRCIFFDGCKAANWLAENIVSQIVVDGRDLANQHIAALAPKRMPIARHQRDRLARCQPQLFPRPIAPLDPVTTHHAAPVRCKLAPIVGSVELEDQSGAATVDDIFGLDHMGVHRRKLILP